MSYVSPNKIFLKDTDITFHAINKVARGQFELRKTDPVHDFHRRMPRTPREPLIDAYQKLFTQLRIDLSKPRDKENPIKLPEPETLQNLSPDMADFYQCSHTGSYPHHAPILPQGEWDKNNQCWQSLTDEKLNTNAQFEPVNTTRKNQFQRYILQQQQAHPLTIFANSWMDNHTHLCGLWHLFEYNQHHSELDILLRYHLIHPETFKVRKYCNSYQHPQHPRMEWLIDKLNHPKQIKKMRKKLQSISHFHQELKTNLAKIWNKNDNQNGAFWGKRCKYIKITNQPQLLKTIAYIENNPLAAGLCPHPEDAHDTSLCERLKCLFAFAINNFKQSLKTPAHLYPLPEKSLPVSTPLNPTCTDKNNQPYQPTSVRPNINIFILLHLIDQHARIPREDKNYLKPNSPNIFERIQLKLTQQHPKSNSNNIFAQFNLDKMPSHIENLLHKISIYNEYANRLHEKFSNNPRLRLGHALKIANAKLAEIEAIENKAAQPPG